MGSLLLGGSRETPGARGKDGRAVGGQVLLLTCSRSGGRISPGCSCSAQPQHPSPPGSEDPAARKTGENNPRGSPRYVMNKHVVAVRMSQNKLFFKLSCALLLQRKHKLDKSKRFSGLFNPFYFHTGYSMGSTQQPHCHKMRSCLPGCRHSSEPGAAPAAQCQCSLSGDGSGSGTT